MIPQQLTLKNFLSYREATLDFRGLHVACICGANGAGKSSLLEAIAWALWGESRALSEDDVIHLGATEVMVDFIFQGQQHIYRVIRSRYRRQVSTLEFQVQTPKGFRSLTEKGVRATQQMILQHLKLDYDTFINSAYLRQGRADEFMLKRPSDRKQILTDLLKLEQYDQLAERAKEHARQFKAEIGLLEQNLENTTVQLQQNENLAVDVETLRSTLQYLHQRQEQDEAQLRQWRSLQQQRQAWLQHLNLQQQQQQHFTQDCQRLRRELTSVQQQQQQLEAILREAETIATHYTQFQRLHAEEDVQTAKFQAHQATYTRRQHLQQQQAEQINGLKDQWRQAQAQLETLQQQQQDIQQALAKTHDIETALEQLRQARAKLTKFDQLQMKAAPLIQRRQHIQTQLDRAQARLIARLEELQSLKHQLDTQQQRQPQLQQALQEVTVQIEHLEKRRIYQHQVRDKGMERRTFLERLQERQRELERELAEFDHKILMLQNKATDGVTDRLTDAIDINNAWETDVTDEIANLPITTLVHNPKPKSPPSSFLFPPSSFPPCPLCDRPLDEHHWNVVLERHRAEQEEIRGQLWVLREQLTTSDREIRVLRQEYRELEKELTHYGAISERKGQLQQQLQGTIDGQARLQHITAEQVEIERSLNQHDYAMDLHEELRLIDQTLQQLNYDDRNHALIRGEVDRWRWAEIKYAEIKQAQKRQAQIAARQPELERTIATLEHQLNLIAASPLQQQIDELTRHIGAIGYNLDHHTALRQALRQAQTWQLRYQELIRAQQQYPQVQHRMRELVALWATRTQALQTVVTQVQVLENQLEQTPDPIADLQSLENQIQQRRSQLDEHLAHLGRLQQQQQQLNALSTQHSALSTQLEVARRQFRVHQELAQAFGKNGIQALMIENILPQLEAEANQILGRLSANQLHIQFVTQRAKRGASVATRNSAKLIDTLDILISDVQGTRPYETYSGGEAFRVNFAIRLALARLLAQRSGTALQLLIVDEGFGTQDEEGCARLIGAINAIASDFACILTVTHIPHLKEAFQTRIEVYKTDRGSQVRLLN
ncbi:MAG: AAA family ATPase [Cyanobacteria bacterium CRU_2_1]|nr:AAA family ATPase [Cyanobacteria bacterium RU_5_0]NJR60591.1 AAA family ATPase [Cyanobacteria bacterium CRU_2_1]